MVNGHIGGSVTEPGMVVGFGFRSFPVAAFYDFVEHFFLFEGENKKWLTPTELNGKESEKENPFYFFSYGKLRIGMRNQKRKRSSFGRKREGIW